jgi:ATP-dependent DNA helicase RecG
VTTPEEFPVLDVVHREQPVPGFLKPRLEPLLGQGIIVRIGRDRGVRYLLSRRFYWFRGKPGIHTRRRVLDRQTNKALLFRHLQHAFPNECAKAEIEQVVPNLSRSVIKRLLSELPNEGTAILNGTRCWARYFAAGSPCRSSLVVVWIRTPTMNHR